MEQLSIFGVSDNQNHYNSEIFGQLEFFATNNDKWTDNCRKCLLYRSKECLDAPCDVEERKDRQRGYFSIHEMPKY